MLIVVMLLAACTSASPPPEFTPPAWTRQSVPTLPYERLQDVRGFAGWNGGFVVAGLYYVSPVPGGIGTWQEIPVLHLSADGQTWREMPMPNIQSFASGEAAAGYSDRGYVLGNNEGGPVVLTLEGDAWTSLPLPGATAEDKAASIAAGPRGVVVVTVHTEPWGEAEVARIWYSADGRTFSGPAEPNAFITTTDAWCLAATERGFLLPMFDLDLPPEIRSLQLYESVDGRDWTVTDPAFPESEPDHHLSGMEAVQYHRGVTVAFGTMWDSTDGPSPIAWYRRDGEPWQRTELDPGRLPDAGVEPANMRFVSRVYRWGSGFLGLGVTAMASGVWTSADGMSWHRTPVRDNGFESSHQLRLATDGKTSLLLRKSPRIELTGPTEIWRAR